MEFKRKRARIIVDISVTLTTVLDTMEARIIDLSEHGAQIVGATMPKGGKFQIEYRGQTVYAQCMWSEIDRIGVRFPFPMTEGPLHEELLMAMATHQDGSDQQSGSKEISMAAGNFMPPPTGFGAGSARRGAPASFGRRSAS